MADLVAATVCRAWFTLTNGLNFLCRAKTRLRGLFGIR